MWSTPHCHLVICLLPGISTFHWWLSLETVCLELQLSQERQRNQQSPSILSNFLTGVGFKQCTQMKDTQGLLCGNMIHLISLAMPPKYYPKWPSSANSLRNFRGQNKRPFPLFRIRNLPSFVFAQSNVTWGNKVNEGNFTRYITQGTTSCDLIISRLFKLKRTKKAKYHKVHVLSHFNSIMKQK